MRIAIGDKLVGPGQPVFIIAEIGINHNGYVERAEQLIDIASETGCDAVKFQKRTVTKVYTPEQLAQPRISPVGVTNAQLKHWLELTESEYQSIKERVQTHEALQWTASAWDKDSATMLSYFDVPFFKIASASLTDDELLQHHRKLDPDKPIILSTGMSTLEQIDHAVEVLGTKNLILLQCTSTYPSEAHELNLLCIETMKQRYGVPVGYSGHERGLATTVAAVALGACVIERHITLDRSMWGSDQAASLEPKGLKRLVRDIRTVETAFGDGVKRVYDSEYPIIEKLRRHA